MVQEKDKKDKNGKDKDLDPIDEKELLRSEGEGFGTIAEGYRAESDDDEEKEDT